MKKIYTLLLSLLLCGVIPALGADIPFEGEGTQASPYLIKSKADLISFSQMTTVSDMMGAYSFSQTFDGKYFKLVQDIDMENDPEFIGLYFGLDGSINASFLKKVKFMGTFDGDGHTIKNMKLNGVVWVSEPSAGNLGSVNAGTSQDVTALFGRVGGNGKVMNLNIDASCQIQGYKNVGAIVGNLIDKATIENCRNYANVTGYLESVGGIVGWAELNSGLSDCYNAGDITAGSGYVGGIAGKAHGLVSRCANAGNVSTKALSSNISVKGLCGGIAGMANSSNITNNCLNVGSVSGTSGTGGIAGEIQGLKTCLNYGMVNCTEASTAGGVAAIFSGTAFSPHPAGCAYDSQIITIGALGGMTYDGITAMETSALTSGKAIEGFAEDCWQFDAGLYPVLKKFASEPKLDHARRVIVNIAAGETADQVVSDIKLASASGLKWSLSSDAKFSIIGNTLKVPSAKMENFDNLTAAFTDYIKVIPLRYTGEGKTGPFVGEGTENSPYLLSNKEDLIKLAQLTSSDSQSEAPSKENFKGKHFLITNDIDMEYTTDFQGISVAAPALLQFYVHFDGVLDGGGHTIHRLNINNIVWEVSPEEAGNSLPTVDNAACHERGDYRSFVGRLGDGGVIRNLNIAADCKIVGNTPVGGIVAEMYDGALVENCRNYADITGYNSQVGGIAGCAYERSIIRDCYNAGNILTGALYAGGITGNIKGVIENCANTGNVTARQISTNIPDNNEFLNGVGGIAGNATATDAAITNCLNAGQIYATKEAGGLLGSFGMASYSMNYGVVSVKSGNRANSGNIFGNKANMTGKFPLYLYYDSQINPVQALSNEDYTYYPDEHSEGIPATIPTLTSNMVSGEGLLNLDPKYWQFAKDTYPVLKKFADEPKLKLASKMIAEMQPSDRAVQVKDAIKLYPAEGISWSSDLGFSVNGNVASTTAIGEGRLTAKSNDGSLTKTIYCTIYAISGIDDIVSDKDVTSSEWYDLQGRRVQKPSSPDGNIYILLTRYSDGTTKTLKVLNR